MYKKLIVVILVLGLTGISKGLVFEDNFDHITYPSDSWARVNYQGWYEDNVLAWPNPGGDWNIGGWDGYQSLPDLDTGVSPTLAAYNHVETFNAGMGEGTDPSTQSGHPGNAGGTANGVLRIISIGSGWSDDWNTGPFLYKNVEGDFVAEVEIVGQSHIYHNLGGLMAREPNPSGEGANENWVYLTYFPEWGVGNHIRDTVNGASVESAIKGFPCDPFLKLSRVGTTFFFETSPDGVTFTSLPGLEAGVDRPDLSAEIQVGIFQANYAGDWIAPMDFDNFSIVPEPATIALFGLGGLALIRRKRN